MISFDLDSTLCDTRHRRTLLDEWDRLKKDPDWDEYSMLCSDDEPTGLTALAQLIQKMGCSWHAVSGRSECARERTLEWMARHGLRPDSLSLCDDNEEHSLLGHTAWKLRAIRRAHARFGITIHYDDSPALIEAMAQELPEVRGILATPPGATFLWEQR